MIIGVGCDIVQMERLKSNQEQLAKRVLTASEYELYNGLSNQRKIEFLAGRWAAKEAIYKANNMFKTIANIEVLNDALGNPVCTMSGYTIHVSIAHENEYAIAYAICER